MRKLFTCMAIVFLSAALGPIVLFPCTNILVTKGASANGSTFITYSADSHTLYGELRFIPPGRHFIKTIGFEGSDAMVDVYEWDTGKYLGKIKQVEETYTVVGNMNEYQVAIGETTYGGREGLHNPKGIVDYGSLMFLALQRARTARKAIEVMASLVGEYGYCSEGESFSVSDPNEVWILEMTGKGPDKLGAVWVALKVPDGYICAHANQARIRTFPFQKSNNWSDPKQTVFHSPDVISFAREKGWFSGQDKDFSFADTYAPLSFVSLRACEARVWNVFRRTSMVTKQMDRYKDYAMGYNPGNPMPLWIKPDNKLSLQDMMQLMRDHFEGTDLDMTQDVGAGPFKLPYRWRPLTWKVKGEDNAEHEYVNERAISTQQTGFSFIAQSRSWLPNPIGGVFWFGVDDTFSTVYVPMYCGIRQVPRSYAEGTATWNKFTLDSAFWVFNFVANYAYSRYSDMIQDIQVVQRELEGKFIADQEEVEQVALTQWKQSPLLARDFLTRYSCELGEMTVKRWLQLGFFLYWKYLDGNVRDAQGNVTHPSYPQGWYRRIVKERGEILKVAEEKKK